MMAYPDGVLDLFAQENTRLNYLIILSSSGFLLVLALACMLRYEQVDHCYCIDARLSL